MRVVCFNVNNRLRVAARRSRVMIAEMLRRLRPDILCLQEVNSVRHARWIAKQLQMTLAAQVRGGMTILVRPPKFRVLRVRTAHIPHSYWNYLLAVQVKPAAGRPFWVGCSHLSSSSYKRNERRRLGEVEWLTRRFEPDVALWAGDWNSTSHLDDPDPDHAKACEGKRRRVSCAMQERRWSDLQEFVGGRPENTWLPAKSLERIDRIYVRPKPRWRVRRFATLTARDFPFLNGRWPTGNDHALILADLARN